MPGQYKCPCGADLPTLKGLRSHQSQSWECRAWARRAKRAVSTSNSEDDMSEEPSQSKTPPVEPMQPSDNDSEMENINISSPLPPDPPIIQDSDEELMPTASPTQKRHHVHVEEVEEDEPPEADSVYLTLPHKSM